MSRGDRPDTGTTRALGSLLLLVLGSGACMRAAPVRGLSTGPPSADSATVLLWSMDDLAGERVADSGRHRLDGIAGNDTDVDFGLYGNTRVFTESLESFVFLPYDPRLDASAALTVEAWIYVDAFGRYEDTPIAGRWTTLPNEQSWLFSILGSRLSVPGTAYESPGDHLSLALLGTYRHLMLALQLDEAGPPVTFYSTLPIESGRWTHVAATFDGQVVRFLIDGRLDAQFAQGGRIRATRAPLMVGNSFDPRWLTDFGGTLRIGTAVDRTPYYAFQGKIDELRISDIARPQPPPR